MTTKADCKEWNVCLENLEKQLETPRVPGEQAAWVARVESLAQLACEGVQRRVESDHPGLLEAIGEEDAELLSRVEQMKQQGCELQEQWHEFVRNAQRLRDTCRAAEPDEAKMRGHVDELAAEGLRLIIETRSLELALDTWLGESLSRDRGDVD